MDEPQCAIIAIDGPAGSGKTTLAQGLARRLGIPYLCTGSTYRALALKALRNGINLDDAVESVRLLKSVTIDIRDIPDGPKSRVFIGDEDVTNELSSKEASLAASTISTHAEVRRIMVNLQRRIIRRLCNEHISAGSDDALKAVAVEGRDVGTVIFPEAEVKIYLDAALEERTRRHMSDMSSTKSETVSVMKSIMQRDTRDIERPVGPLKPAPDAIVIDNTNWPASKTLDRALKIVHQKLRFSSPKTT